MPADNIKTILQKLTDHHFIKIVSRGNAAITAALSIFPPGSTILIPQEGGWIHYQKAPLKLGLKVLEVGCDDAKINLVDLQKKIKVTKAAAFLYQNPGGYFAQQPMKEIYELCHKNKCVIIMDVSGSIGTPLCDGRYADILVGSFGKDKLVNAGVGGFISAHDENVWGKIKSKATVLDDETSLQAIYQQLLLLPKRIDYLQRIRKKILFDLHKFKVLYPHDTGLVVVVKYEHETEKQRIIEYCTQYNHSYTQCPRYIRLNTPAISIEVKKRSNLDSKTC